jgi:hypothetical protein
MGLMVAGSFMSLFQASAQVKDHWYYHNAAILLDAMPKRLSLSVLREVGGLPAESGREVAARSWSCSETLLSQLNSGDYSQSFAASSCVHALQWS